MLIYFAGAAYFFTTICFYIGLRCTRFYLKIACYQHFFLYSLRKELGLRLLKSLKAYEILIIFVIIIIVDVTAVAGIVHTDCFIRLVVFGKN